jgi:Tfp pilus assembly protein PilF
VVSAAIRWLDENSSRPFFLFIHLYDLHTPYTLPSARDRSGRSGYEIELKYVDEALGQFWEYLAGKGLLAKALVVLVSDHGESLGEHGEQTHQYFIYQSTLWVPLIFHWPLGAGPYPAQVDQPAMLLDVAPTVLQFLGIPRPPQFQGRSLFELLSPNGGRAARGVYSESLYARDHLGCSALRSLRLGHYKYIAAPKQELYDLQSDPHELRNLYEQQSSVAQSLRQQLLELRSGMTPAPRTQATEPSREAMAMLNSLGYTELTYPQTDADDSGCDPKDRLAEYRRYGRAIADAQRGNDREAIQGFKQVTASDPQNALAHYYLAASYFHVRAWDEAVRELRQTLQLSPYDTRAHELLATIWLEKGDYERAQEEYHQLLKLAPHNYGGNYNLGMFAVGKGQFDEGIHYLRAAVEADPESPAAHNALGVAYFRAGDARQAEREFEQAVSLEPKNAAAHYNLGLALRQQKHNAAAAQEFQKALEDDPTDRRAREALDQLRNTPETQ